MPRDESQILLLLMGEQEPQQQQQRQPRHITKPAAHHRYLDAESSLFSDSEHSQYYALPYDVNHRNHMTAQTPAASALPKVQIENDQAAQHLRFDDQWSSSWEPLDIQCNADRSFNNSNNNSNNNAKHHHVEHSQQMSYGSEFDQNPMHGDGDQPQRHWQSLYGLNRNPLLSKIARDRMKIASHVVQPQQYPGLHTNPYLNQRAVFEQTKQHHSWTRQERFLHDLSPSYVGAAASMSVSDSTYGASSASHPIQRPQQPQFPSPRSDSNSPDCMSPFSSSSTATSQYSSADYKSDTTTASSSVDESEEIRDTASVYSLDSYELMASLFSSQLVIGGAAAAQKTSLMPISVFSSSASASSNVTPTLDHSAAVQMAHPLPPADMMSPNSSGQQQRQHHNHHHQQQQMPVRKVPLQAFHATPTLSASSPWMADASPNLQHPQRSCLPFDPNNFSQGPTASTAEIGPKYPHSANPDPFYYPQQQQQQQQQCHRNINQTTQDTRQPNPQACCYSIVYEVEFKRNTLRFVGGSGLDDLTVGEFVFVEADRGEHLGQVSQTLLLNSPPIIQPIQQSCAELGGVYTSDSDAARRNSRHHSNCTVAGHVLRRATMKDVQKITFKSKEEAKATLVANQKVKDYVLEMEIIDSEFQFDMKKLTFFYKAQQRVDFRELVRDLYKLYRARIWMQKVDDNIPLI